jgi:DNA-binding response OmpR family regulator
MARATILMVEPEPNEALSVRKLVVETAKFNVTTAYSASEGMELLRKFPLLDGLVVVAEVPGCEDVVKEARSLNPTIPVILLSANLTSRCHDANHLVSSHEPETLVHLLRSLFGNPRKAA